MKFQVLFSTRDAEAVFVDGLLTVDDGTVQPATIIGARGGEGLLDVIIPATLDKWADEMAVVDVFEAGPCLQLRSHDTQLLLRPVNVRN